MSSFFNITILLESALKQLNSDTITEFFSNVLIGIFILAILFFTFVYPKKHSRLFSFATNFVDYSPVLLTSVGILGTFTGIVAGLLNFDITNIDSSISALLGGMKTAFLSSVIGVGLSIVLKIIYNLKYSEKRNAQPVNILSLIEKFYEQAEHTKDQTDHIKALSESIHTLTKAIGGDADNSLLSQFKLLRSDIADNNKAIKQILEPISQNITHLKELSENSKLEFVTFETQLWTKLDNFAEMMSKSATEQVIEALKQVITEFNQHLVEQFGDNFKQLNHAVLALITWQDNYKTQLTEMIKLYETGVKTLSDTERSVTSIENSTQEIPKTMANLSQVISTNQAQINDLGNHLSAFAELKEKATAAIPEVKSQIDLMLQGVTEGNKQLINGLNDSSKELISGLNQSGKELINELSQGGKELHKSLDTITHEVKNTADTLLKKHKDMQSEFEQLNNSLHTNFEELIRTQSNEVRKLMNQLAQEGENALKVTGESVNKQLKLIDDSMQSEINRVMNEMGKALATISSKFTTDYKDLVNQMYTITSYKKGH
ncbi:MotA/TolQ/ExbB proton channel family protein [Pasteurella sp. PK-2025]|uniref:MotA/TolQ/ExbB proton channel family protein n=1 Tax=Pasteurella sp. PK-2025 TaxID=3413133 RepID=UPI003C785AAF